MEPEPESNPKENKEPHKGHKVSKFKALRSQIDP
jgi:hypothetical protein